MKSKELLLTGVLSILLSAGMVSCNDDEPEKIFNPNEPTELRLKSQIEGESRDDFIYNENNHCVTINKIWDGNLLESTNFDWENNSVSNGKSSSSRTEFIENGRIEKRVSENTFLGNKFTKVYDYTYNSSGRLIKIENDQEDNKEIIDLEWNRNKLVKMTYSVKSDNMKMTETFEYFYSGKKMKGADQTFVKVDYLSLVAKVNPELVGLVSDEMPDGIVITLNQEFNFGELTPGADDVIFSILERSMIVIDAEASADGYIKRMVQKGEKNGLNMVTYIDKNEDGQITEDERNVKEEYNEKIRHDINYEWDNRTLK